MQQQLRLAAIHTSITLPIGTQLYILHHISYDAKNVLLPFIALMKCMLCTTVKVLVCQKWMKRLLGPLLWQTIKSDQKHKEMTLLNLLIVKKGSKKKKEGDESGTTREDKLDEQGADDEEGASKSGGAKRSSVSFSSRDQKPKKKKRKKSENQAYTADPSRFFNDEAQEDDSDGSSDDEYDDDNGNDELDGYEDDGWIMKNNEIEYDDDATVEDEKFSELEKKKKANQKSRKKGVMRSSSTSYCDLRLQEEQDDPSIVVIDVRRVVLRTFTDYAKGQSSNAPPTNKRVPLFNMLLDKAIDHHLNVSKVPESQREKLKHDIKCAYAFTEERQHL